jgi:hypothetical protein
MEKKTMTTLGQLRIGDRFTYSAKRSDVWSVMARADKSKRVAVNQLDPNKTPLHKYDELKKASKDVMFLRHGIPQPQEECFLEDLEVGDTFFKPDDIITEFVLQEKGSQFYKVRKVSEAAYIMAGRLAVVVLSKKKEEAA